MELTKTNILVEAPNDHITGPLFWGSQFVCLNPFWFEWIEGVLLKVFRFPWFSSPCPFNDDFGQGQLLPYPLISDRWMLQCFRVGFLWTKTYFKIQSVLSRLNSLIPDGINEQTNFLLKKRTPYPYIDWKVSTVKPCIGWFSKSVFKHNFFLNFKLYKLRDTGYFKWNVWS